MLLAEEESKYQPTLVRVKGIVRGEPYPDNGNR